MDVGVDLRRLERIANQEQIRAVILTTRMCRLRGIFKRA
jgi:hypothetical protein